MKGYFLIFAGLLLLVKFGQGDIIVKRGVLQITGKNYKEIIKDLKEKDGALYIKFYNSKLR